MSFPSSFRTSFALLLLPTLVSACGYDTEGKTRLTEQPEPTLRPSPSGTGGAPSGTGGAPSGTGGAPVTPAKIRIDADATIDDKATGVGIFVEYAADGRWTLSFTCDTAQTKTSCEFSATAQSLTGKALSKLDSSGFDADDLARVGADGVFEIFATTGTEVDQVSFMADPGATVGFDLWLEGTSAPQSYVFWVSDGALNAGVSSSSFDVTPIAR